MKKLWRRASGRIKDRNSLLMASMAKKSRYRNPDLESAVIRATSHDDTFVDYKNAQRVFTWVRTSPSHLTVVLWALSRRGERTRDWVVALKSLILLHGILCTKAPGTRRIGRLPFDLSGFNDAYTRNGARLWARNTFVRAYFGFVDLKSVVLAAELKEETALVGAPKVVEEKEGGGGGARVELVRVQRWQDLLCAVLQVRPQGKGMTDDVLVLEAMDCMIIEVFQLYSKICQGIANALMKIYTDKLGKAEEAGLALDVLKKATKQGQELSDYFELCRRIGVLHPSECPKIEEIPQEDFVELERIINGSVEVVSSSSSLSEQKLADSEESKFEGALVVVEDERNDNSKPWLRTVITDKWEVFEEDNINSKAIVKDPFEASYNVLPPPLLQFNPFIDYGGTTTPSQLLIGLS